MVYPYLSLGVLFLFAGVIVLSFLLVARLLGPKQSSPVKDEPFESGNPPRGDARIRFPIQFYLVAMLFLIFDIEVVFLYPWAILLRELGMQGLAVMGVFLFLLTVGFVYEWKKGAMDWD
jgi:NADH-quinone oxidoreductase subunit A